MKSYTEINKILKPLEFDSHFFSSNWQAPNYGFYQKFHISSIQVYKEHLALPLLPHRRAVHYFMFLTKGTVSRSKGLNSYEIKAGQIFFLPAEQISTFENISEDAQGFYCHFQPDILYQAHLRIDIENDFPFFLLKSEPIVELKNISKIEKLCNFLNEEYVLSDKDRFNLVPVFLLAILLECKYSIANTISKTKTATEVITNKYKNALSEYIYEKKTVAEFAKYLSVSANHLNKCVKDTTGKSAHDLLQEMRILEAKVLLKQSELNIGEIAFKVGQFETSDFSRLFKKYTNITPRQFRLDDK